MKDKSPKLITTSLIDALSDDSDLLFCKNMKHVAEYIIEKFPEEVNIELHQKFASVCFFLKLSREYHKLVSDINYKIHSQQGYVQEDLYKYLLHYISSMDSILDILDKTPSLLKLNSGKSFYRTHLGYNSNLNDIRNFMMHDGIPFCRIEKTVSQSWSTVTCCDVASVVEHNVSFSLSLIFNSERLLKKIFALDDLLIWHIQLLRDVEDYLALILTAR